MIDLNQLLPVPQRMDLGRAYMESGDFERSALVFESAWEIEPMNYMALCNAASVYLKGKNIPRAREMAERAVTAGRDSYHPLRIMGQVLQEERKWQAAEFWFNRAVALGWDDPGNLTTAAYFYQLTGNYARALYLYTRARDLNPMDLTARHWRSMTMLTMAKTQAEWDEALAEYEIRHVLVQQIFGVIPKPMYTGEVDEPGNLLLVAEQGVGDAVMMARYVRDLKKPGSPFRKVFILCREVMVDLLGFTDGVDGVYSQVADVPEFSWWTPMMSLLRTEGWPTNQPGAERYLGDGLWGTSNPGIKNIGICWKGNPEHGNDRYRSVSIETLMRALEGVDARIWSLQEDKDNTNLPDRVKPPRTPVNGLERLSDVINWCDLVVTVDTAVLHLAGAMGVPVMALIPSNPDWRWGPEGDRTPWYPGARLFRAKQPLEWDEALERMNAAIKETVK